MLYTNYQFSFQVEGSDPKKTDTYFGGDRDHREGRQDAGYDRYGRSERPGDSDRHHGSRDDRYGGSGRLGESQDRDRGDSRHDQSMGGRFGGRQGEERSRYSTPGSDADRDRYGRSGEGRHREEKSRDWQSSDDRYGDRRSGYGRSEHDSYGQDRGSRDRYARPDAAKDAYGRDVSRESTDQYGRQATGGSTSDYDRRRDEPSRDSYHKYGRSGPTSDSRDRASTGSHESRFNTSAHGDQDWQDNSSRYDKPQEGNRWSNAGRDQARPVGSSRWGEKPQDDFSKLPPTTGKPDSGSRWGAAERDYGSFARESEAQGSPSTSWQGFDSYSNQPEETEKYGSRNQADRFDSAGRPADNMQTHESRRDNYGRDHDMSRGRDSYGRDWSSGSAMEPSKGTSSSRWEDSSAWSSRQEQQYSGSSWDRQDSQRKDDYSRQQSAWGSQDPSWASKPPPPPPEDKPPKPAEKDMYGGWGSQNKDYYGGYGDTSATDKSSGNQSSEWADYWKRQDPQTSSGEKSSVESWSTSAKPTSAYGSSQSKTEPPPPQQTWSWSPQGWQLTASSSSTSQTPTASSASVTGGLHQPPPPPPPQEEDTLKKKKSRWGIEESESQSKPSSQPEQASYDAYGYPIGQSQYDSYSYGSYGSKYSQGQDSTQVSSSSGTYEYAYGSKAPSTTAAPASQSTDSYSTSAGYAMLSTSSAPTGMQQLAAQQAAADVSKAFGAGLLGAHPGADPAELQAAAAAAVADQTKLASAGLASLPTASTLAAMHGRGVPPQALVGAPVMAPGVAPTAVAPGFIGIYQPPAFGAGAPIGSFRGRLAYQPR